MKTKIIFTGILIFSLSCQSFFAQEVSIETAEKVAKNLYYEKAQSIYDINFEDILISEVFTRAENGIPFYYVFNIANNQGFVIIAADENVQPVLGYSVEGSYNDTLQPPAFTEWMKYYEEQILFIKENHLQANEQLAEEWKNLLTNEANYLKSTTSGFWLLETEWDQGCYYNEECPECFPSDPCEEICGHTLVGCVATAMGQIMKHHDYPYMGTGDTSYYCYGGYYVEADFEKRYDWNKMFDGPLGNYNEDIATLLFHCGASVGMNYGFSSSGAAPQNVSYALKRRFSYAATAKYIEKDDYSTSEWEIVLKNELDANRPMHYRGENQYGGTLHSFVCDGYNGSMFHFNWGVDGEANDFFDLDLLDPYYKYESHNFSYEQAATIGIQPASYATLPYSTGFESGLDDAWAIQSSTKYGRIQVTANYSPHSGSKHLTMDVKSNGHYNRNYALLHLNLDGESDVDLNFWWKEFNDESHPTDGVYFSDNGGLNFSKVHSLTGNNGSWEQVPLDVDQLAATYNLELSKTFVIKFQQYDNYKITIDGFAFDDISVSAPVFPDLKIQSQNVSPWIVSPGSGTMASCIVRNQGDGAAGPSTLKYYISNNTTYSVDDVYLGYDPVGSLGPNGTSSESEMLTIPPGTQEGLWFILFFADANQVINESDENNNVGSFRISVLDMKSRTQIYPNPAENYFTIKLPVANVRSIITMVNMEGKSVKEIMANESIIKVSTEGIPAGQYFVKIRILNENFSKQIQIIK